jgi:hypothetical protein
MASDDPQDPVFELWLIMTTALEAVKVFNTEQPDTIQVIGFLAEDLCTDRLTPEHVGEIIRSVYEKMLSATAA